MLSELIALLTNDEREVLLQVAVSNLPVTLTDLHTIVTDAGRSIANLEQVIARLNDLTVLVVFDDNSLWVHRWTAEALQRATDPVEHRERAERAGRHRLNTTGGGIELNDAIEATRNLLTAQAWDIAAEIANQVYAFLAPTSTVALVNLAGEFQRVLPISHPTHKIIADHEGQALLALGFTAAAETRYQQLIARTTAARHVRTRPRRLSTRPVGIPRTVG